MSAAPTARLVRLPDPAGGPDLDLLPGLELWEAIESKYGNLGALFLEHHAGRTSFRLMAELVWRCAREAGSTLTYAQVAQRCYVLGLFRLSEVVDQLWRDITKPSDEPAEGGDADSVPLVAGD